MADRLPGLSEGDLNMKKLGDGVIRRSLNSIIAKYRDLSVCHRSIICFRIASLQKRRISGSKGKTRYTNKERDHDHEAQVEACRTWSRAHFPILNSSVIYIFYSIPQKLPKTASAADLSRLRSLKIQPLKSTTSSPVLSI